MDAELERGVVMVTRKWVAHWAHVGR